MIFHLNTQRYHNAFASLILLCCFMFSKPSSAAWSLERQTLHVQGQRCLWVPSSTASSSYSASQQPPLVLLGGLGQTIASYESHLPFLSKDRNVLVYECRGQGLWVDDDQHDTKNDVENDHNLYYSNVTLPFQAERLLSTISTVIGDNVQQYDLVGFSLGARIAMAAAAILNDDGDGPTQQQQQQHQLRKLHLTGVATERSLQGKVALQAWADLTRAHNLQGFAWSALQTTYSPTFLYANRHRVNGWIQHLCTCNSVEGIHALLEQTHPESQTDPWHVVQMAQRIAGTRGCLVVGEEDVMAPLDGAKELADLLGWNDPAVIPECGHAVPMEQPRQWRTHVLDFLNDA